jgi:hypothetical protein
MPALENELILDTGIIRKNARGKCIVPPHQDTT